MGKKKKKKASKAVRASKKPISITGLIGDKVIYHLEISHLTLRERLHKRLCTPRNSWLK